MSKESEVEAKDNAKMCKELKEKCQCVVELNSTRNALYLAQKQLEAEAKERVEWQKDLDTVKNMVQKQGEEKEAAQRKCHDLEERNQTLGEENAELKHKIKDIEGKLFEKITENSNFEEAAFFSLQNFLKECCIIF